ncbi:MAG: methyltransferase domain-containing protein [Pseudomonadota bacterium]
MTSTSDADPDTDLSHDAFLGGRVMAWQPKRGFRAGIDTLLLAAAVPAKADQTVLELGCGVGVASMALAARVPAQVTGVERQPDYAALAARNGVEVVNADLATLPHDLRQRSFDHVMINPPYYDRTRRLAATDTGREDALAEDTPLDVWMQVAAQRLKPKGTLTVIYKTPRLDHLLAALPPSLGSRRILPLQPRTGRDSHLVLLRARKDGKDPLRLHAPQKIHAAARHEADKPDYTPEIEAVLLDAAALSFPD